MTRRRDFNSPTPSTVAVSAPSVSVTEIAARLVGSQEERRLAGTSIPPPEAPCRMVSSAAACASLAPSSM